MSYESEQFVLSNVHGVARSGQSSLQGDTPGSGISILSAADVTCKDCGAQFQYEAPPVQSLDSHVITCACGVSEKVHLRTLRPAA